MLNITWVIHQAPFIILERREDVITYYREAIIRRKVQQKEDHWQEDKEKRYLNDWLSEKWILNYDCQNYGKCINMIFLFVHFRYITAAKLHFSLYLEFLWIWQAQTSLKAAFWNSIWTTSVMPGSLLYRSSTSNSPKPMKKRSRNYPLIKNKSIR